jgi:hypothetical protein
MSNVKPRVLCTLFFAVTLTCIADSAMAYTGPGAGITALGSFVALVSVLFLGVVGFVWYPIKRLLGLKNRRKRAKTGQMTATEPQ